MTRATLTRFSYGPDSTLGLLVVPGLAPIYTIEDAWRDNARNISCIPDGDYEVVPSRFNKRGYDAWEILGVPSRTLIKIHIGVHAEHVQGCVIVGEWLTCVAGKISLARSQQAFGRLYALLGGQRWRLSIRPAEGLPGARLLDPQQEA